MLNSTELPDLNMDGKDNRIKVLKKAKIIVFIFSFRYSPLIKKKGVAIFSYAGFHKDKSGR